MQGHTQVYTSQYIHSYFLESHIIFVYLFIIILPY